MKFVLAPDSFKESMTAKQAALAMEEGIRKVFPNAECVIIPMADGGEGTVDSLVDYTDGNIHEVEVTGPLGDKVSAAYGITGDGKTAILEMASASGIHLIKQEDRNPLLTTSYGTGELIKHVLDRGVSRILMGIGGSVTNDGGVGMLQALGVSFQDEAGQELPFGGGSLNRLHRIDVRNLDKRLSGITFEVACDVSNPLIGPSGASAIFGPQKGATHNMIEVLDHNLKHYAEIIHQQLGVDIAHVEGAGAAGGLGAGLMAFLQVEMKKGIDLVIEYTELEKRMSGAAFVFTGEGSIDGQTRFGKTPYGVASIAKKYGIPVIAFSGAVGEDVECLYEHGFTAIVGIMKGVTPLDEALRQGSSNLSFAVENVCRLLKLREPK